MKIKESQILKTWEKSGLYSEQLLSSDECDLYIEESDRIRVERNKSTIPYKQPLVSSASSNEIAIFIISPLFA